MQLALFQAKQQQLFLDIYFQDPWGINRMLEKKSLLDLAKKKFILYQALTKGLKLMSWRALAKKYFLFMDGAAGEANYNQ